VTVVIPTCQDYSIRSQVFEGALLSEPLKPAIARYYADKRDFPADNQSAGLPKPAALHGKYVQQMEVVNGIILATYGGNAASRRIALGVLAYVPEAAGSAAAIAWQCNTPATTLPNKYLPQACWK
jgi:type IV pilus assembly protein PilA